MRKFHFYLTFHSILHVAMQFVIYITISESDICVSITIILLNAIFLWFFNIKKLPNFYLATRARAHSGLTP